MERTNMKQLLSKIGITEAGHFSEDDNYVIDIETSDSFSKIFSKLDKSDLVEENEDASVVDVDVTNVMYTTEDYTLNLIADFKNDLYKKRGK